MQISITHMADYFLYTCYSFRPPDSISLMKYFFPNKNINITGADSTIEPAHKSPHRTISLKLLLNWDSAMGSVVISGEFVTINGHIKLFQVVIKVNNPNVTTALTDIGSAILKNTSQMLHPSILAASSISTDIPENHCLIRKTPNPPNIPGIISA